MADPLGDFSPPVRLWFEQTYGVPTPPQILGWPPIQRGEHTLLLAPTGSGKTLAAFLWAIDEEYRRGMSAGNQRAGVRVVYISPLKALSNDIERNLRSPLQGIRQAAADLGLEWPRLHAAVRTGDTPAHARTQMWRHPPQILITTPESLYLLLTSPRAREMFRTAATVIVDEIHTLCGNKRGVHLSLSLERLQKLAENRIQRIGLSATQRPLDEVARFLGGQEARPTALTTEPDRCDEEAAWSALPRPVTIVDAGYHKDMRLEVVTAVADFRDLPGDSVWPAVIPSVLDDIRRHRTTLVFTNNRRLAERTADRLNAQLAAEQSEEIPPGSPEALAPGGIMRDCGLFALGAAGPIRAHHGSMSKEARRQMEEDLKSGRLPALVGTSSLELGIDIGSVDLVVQLQSPKSVAQGLQRIGRSGHLVGRPSRGRIYVTHREDLIEAAAVARGMLEGDIEPTYTPRNPLDVLAQQIVAMVAMEDWSVPALFHLAQQAYAYRDLPEDAFRAVVGMLAGRYYQPGAEQQAAMLAALRPRLAWDQTHDSLSALPGSRLLAVSNAGTIPDTGAFGVYLGDGKTRIGELDEEFVFETRVGDVFLLGSHSWQVTDIDENRVTVAQASGPLPRMPFWNGDLPWRTFSLGSRIGRFRRELAAQVQAASEPQSGGGALRQPSSPQMPAASPAWQELLDWLQAEYALDGNSAANLAAYMRRLLDAGGEVASDRTIVVESFRDSVDEPRLVIHSPFGGRVNQAWALALRHTVRELVGVNPESQVSDDGILLRFPRGAGAMPARLVESMTPSEARRRIMAELPGSALFGSQFRLAAGRALLLPRARAGRRTPLWLQRLKAKDLLAIVGKLPDFPVVAEAYRDCLCDVLDLPHLEEILDGIRSGAIRVAHIETAVPTPLAADLLKHFANVYVYEWDAPKAERQLQALEMQQQWLDDLLAPGGEQPPDALLRADAIAEVVGQVRRTASGYQARTREELAAFWPALGDLTSDELSAVCAGDWATWLKELVSQGRAHPISITWPSGQQERWVPAELATEYRAARLAAAPGAPAWESGGHGEPGKGVAEGRGDLDAGSQAAGLGTARAREGILRRWLAQAGPVTAAEVQRHYPFPIVWVESSFEQMAADRELVRGRLSPADGADLQYCERALFQRIARRSLALLRREVQPASAAALLDFRATWQHVQPGARLAGTDGLRQVLEQLRGCSLPGRLWEQTVLPARLEDFSSGDLATLCQAGELVWAGAGRDPRRGHIRFFRRGEGGLFLDPAEPAALSADPQRVYAVLAQEGASFETDLQAMLGLAAAPLRSVLAELAMAGLVTNDSLSTLRLLLSYGGPAPAGAWHSTLEADLAARACAPPSGLPSRRLEDAPRLAGEDPSKKPGLTLPAGDLGHRRSLSTSRYRAARLRIGREMRRAQAEAGGWPGRWALLHRSGVMGPQLGAGERAEQQARALLARHGILTHEGIEQEDGPWAWASLFPQLQRLELRGQVRQGYFVAGLSGAQFALPEAVEALRASATDVERLASSAEALAREAAGGPDRPGAPADVILLNAADPCFLGLPAGALPGNRQASSWLAIWRGQAVLLAEDDGERLSTGQGASMVPGDRLPPEVLTMALRLLVGRPGAPRHGVVRTWNGSPVLGGPGEPLLAALGYYRSPVGMER